MDEHALPANAEPQKRISFQRWRRSLLATLRSDWQGARLLSYALPAHKKPLARHSHCYIKEAVHSSRAPGAPRVITICCLRSHTRRCNPRESP